MDPTPQSGEPGRGPGRSTLVDQGGSHTGARRHARGSLFGSRVPWETREPGNDPEQQARERTVSGGADSTKPVASQQPIESPLGKDVANAGADAGGAIKRSTMRPGGIAQQGFAGTARPLPYQAEMEQSFGTDLSAVKVYADANAKQATHKLGAEAYVVGDKIAFNTAMPDRKTVAHELTHVLQHTGRGGARPANGETDSRGIDMAGEHEAEAVESAVAGGKHAHSALVGAAPTPGVPRKKLGPARKAAGGGFSHGLAFSPDAFKTNFSYQLWTGGPFELPTPFPPVLAFLSPAVTISCEQGVNWDAVEEEDKGLVLSVGVSGTVMVGLSAGSQHVAAVYGGLSASVTGAFTYTLNKDTWSLVGDLRLTSDFSVGVSVAGGIIDYKFQFGQVDPIATLAGISWQNGNFSAGAFEWGPIPKQAFQMMADAANQGQQLVNAGISLATDGVEATTRVIGSAADWSTGAFDKVMGGAGAVVNKAKDIGGDAVDKATFWD